MNLNTIQILSSGFDFETLMKQKYIVQQFIFLQTDGLSYH